MTAAVAGKDAVKLVNPVPWRRADRYILVGAAVLALANLMLVLATTIL